MRSSRGDFQRAKAVARRAGLGLRAAAWLCAMLLLGGQLARAGDAGKRSAASPPDAAAEWTKPPEALLTPESLAEGKRLFVVHCSACHALFGGGGLGPNLTDSLTLHGARYADMFRVISRGVENTGMPSWIAKLGPERVAVVAAYVFSLWGTRPDDPADTDPTRKPRIRFSVIVWMPAAGWFLR